MQAKRVSEMIHYAGWATWPVIQITTFLGNQEINMAWTTPAATDLRFGFEITMYIANR